MVEADPSVAATHEGSDADSDVPRRAKRKKKRLAAFVRWMHIYASMLGLAVTLFFSVTGITLNHADWFLGDSEQVTTIEGLLSDSLITELRNPESTTAKLNAAEHFRSTHQLDGAVKEFTVDEFQSVIAFAGPGYSADIFVDNETAQYEITEIRQGWVAIINDLHKGRDTGPAWSWVIDLSAGILCIISASGLALLFWLKRRLAKGLLTMTAGSVAALAIYWWAVP